MQRVFYLCLQATREGQASHAHVHEIIKGLRLRGFEVDLFEPYYARPGAVPGAVGRAREFLRVQWRLWRRLGERPDALYLRSHIASWPTALLAKMRGIPVVQEVNGPYADLFIAWPWTRRFARLFNWLAGTQFRWARAVIVVTPGLQQWMQGEASHDRVFVIPNGADTELMQPGARIDQPLPCPYAVFFGAMTLWQGIDTLLAAAEHPAWPPGVSLVLAGDGVERPRVEEAMVRNPRIHYLGQIPYKEIPGVVAGGLALIAASRDVDGRARTGLLGLKVFEAMACGIPVVVSDHPGQGDLVRTERCGIPVPPESPAAIAEAIAYLHTHPAERAAMAQRARQAVVRGHSWDQRAAETAEVLRGVTQFQRQGRQ